MLFDQEADALAHVGNHGWQHCSGERATAVAQPGCHRDAHAQEHDVFGRRGKSWGD